MATKPTLRRINQTTLVAVMFVIISALVTILSWFYYSSTRPLLRATSVLFTESGPFHPYGLSSALVFYLPRLDSVVFREVVKTEPIFKRALALGGIDSPSTRSNRVPVQIDAYMVPGKDAYSDVIYVTVDSIDEAYSIKLSTGMARAVVEWNDQRVQSMQEEYVKSLEAQLATVTASASKLRNSNPESAELRSLVDIRSGLIRDIQLMKGIAQTVKGGLKLMAPAREASIVSMGPRIRAILSGGMCFLALVLIWMVYQTYLQATRGSQRGEIHAIAK